MKDQSWNDFIANHHKLNNLICIIDHNKSTNRALIVDDLRKKFISFGWDAFTINGHNEKITFKTIKKAKKKPLAIIANTIKGKGVSFMENNPEWHHKKIDKETLKRISISLKNMRKQFNKTITDIFLKDKKAVMLLGDIGVFAFRHLFKKYPKRLYNIGILEQSMISIAAGISNEGFNPIVHTIAPFIVNRAFEQLKIDFGYNKLKGNFVSIGSSYDYAALGCTHHCPEDVNLMYNIPEWILWCLAVARNLIDCLNKGTKK